VDIHPTPIGHCTMDASSLLDASKSRASRRGYADCCYHYCSNLLFVSLWSVEGQVYSVEGRQCVNSTRTFAGRGSATARLYLVQLATIVAANARHPSGLLDRCRVDRQALDRRRTENCAELAQWTLHNPRWRFRLTTT